MAHLATNSYVHVDTLSVMIIGSFIVTQWLFVRDRMRTYTGYSSGTTKLRVFLRKMKEKSK